MDLSWLVTWWHLSFWNTTLTVAMENGIEKSLTGDTTQKAAKVIQEKKKNYVPEVVALWLIRFMKQNQQGLRQDWMLRWKRRQEFYCGFRCVQPIYLTNSHQEEAVNPPLEPSSDSESSMFLISTSRLLLLLKFLLLWGSHVFLLKHAPIFLFAAIYLPPRTFTSFTEKFPVGLF